MIFRRGTILLWLLLSAISAHALPCARIKAKPDVWVTTNVNALVIAARGAFEHEAAQAAYEQTLDRIGDSVRRCRLAEDVAISSRYQRFLDYVALLSIDRQDDHDLGFLVPNAEYFAETGQYSQIPEFLLDQHFLRAVSRYETLDQAKSFLRLLNAKRSPDDQLVFFSYRSRHLGTPDNDDSFRRLLIVVPGNVQRGVPEKWVQFGITDPGARPLTRNVSVVSTVAGAEGTSNVYFRDFFRTYRRNGSITIKGRWELGEGDDNCALCHKSGVLPIFPERGSVSAAEEAALLAVNRRFLTYGPARFGKYLDAGRFGPGLSASSAEDRRQRFGGAFSETVVGRAMTCVACHNSERLGALNWPMDRVLISSFIKGGKMPLGYELSLAQRRELLAKLTQEYFAIDPGRPGILKSWLLGGAE
jgi:hypothetical protein